MDKNRLQFVDIAKGVCILLVVMGHFNPPGAPLWYAFLIKFIYTFHMPVFMCLSGFLFYKGFTVQQSLLSFIVKKIKRLMIPYFVISILIIFIKLLVQYFITIESPVSVFAFVEMFYSPIAGYFLWFMYTLFILFILVFCFLKYLKNGLLVVSLFSILFVILWIGKVPEYCCLPQAVTMLPVFLLGCWMFKYSSVLQQKIIIPILFFIHLIAFIFIEKSGINGYMLYIYNIIMGLIATVYIVQLAYLIKKPRKLVDIFLLCGVTSNAIYLFHTSSMAPFKYIWLKYMGIETTALFISGAVLIITIGMIIPIILKRLILKNKSLSALILGE